ncbi:MAG: thioredoxin family protein [Anaerolineae bacterium]|nr:MAG: thioredoxin family protein [Anaerolineae bacterium]
MHTIKVLGTGCPTCQRLLADVKQLVANNNWQANVEYVTDIPAILAYGVMSTPALVVDEKVIAVGHPGPAKVAQLIKEAIAA